MTAERAAKRLVASGAAELAGLTTDEILGQVGDLALAKDDALAIHPSRVPASALTGLLRLDGKAGFVVVDMTDLDEFEPAEGIDLPDQPVYVVRALDRGDRLANWSPDEAMPAVRDAGRTPLTITEGLCWLLQAPQMLEPNRCFMTAGSRKRKPRGLDARVPAIWISGGTGRDGRERRGAPKVGWCWAGNRHTWLGFASARERA